MIIIDCNVCYNAHTSCVRILYYNTFQIDDVIK